MAAIRVLVGSGNPVKMAAVREAFSRYYDDVEVEAIEVPSGVPDQPFGEQTFDGARNRAMALRELDQPGDAPADFYVGIEGGVMQLHGRWFAHGSMCVLDRKGRLGEGTSPLFELPPRVVDQVRAGRELGDVMDELTGRDGTKYGGGAIGHFTRGRMDRTDLYVHGLIVALIPFVRPELYAGG